MLSLLQQLDWTPEAPCIGYLTQNEVLYTLTIEVQCEVTGYFVLA